MDKTEKAWHEKHRMPNNPTDEERAEWHLVHSEACGCREVPRGIAGRVADLKALRGRSREG